MDNKTVKIGDYVEVERNKTLWEGTIIQIDSKSLTLKLKSGYNIGIILDKNTKIKKIKVGKTGKHNPVEFKLNFDKTKPLVSILSAGGTIASSIDYSTGAISASYSASQLVSSVPELVNFANIKTKKVLEEMSENMIPKHWKKLANSVFKELKESEGVVITHGTDTLSYTSSMLSFMLRNLNKPVVVTFAQKSSDRGSSDASMNLICSAITATKNIAGVVAVGHGTLSDDYCLINPGTKVRKMHSSQRDSFRPINCLPIGKVWTDGKVKFLGEYTKKEDLKEDCYLDDKIEEKVAIIKFYPGFDPELLDIYIDKGYKGIILEGTGLGHVAEYLFPKIKRAIKEGIAVCMTTQTIYGKVNPYVYSNLRRLSNSGVIYLEDMLTETAYTKLMWVLGHTQNKEEIREMMLRNMCGEFNPGLQPNQFLY